jgi:hypothetical protein
MRVTIVYGGGDTAAGARSSTAAGVGRYAGGANDAATVGTCTTAGRSSLRTTEPDELTKRAMAQVILRQLLDKDALANIKKPDPEEIVTTRIDKQESPVEEETQTSGMDYLWSCCGGKCSSSTTEVPSTSTAKAPSSATATPPAVVPDDATLLTTMTNVTGNTTNGSSYSEGSSSWLSDSIQSSLSSTDDWW